MNLWRPDIEKGQYVDIFTKNWGVVKEIYSAAASSGKYAVLILHITKNRSIWVTIHSY
jgi:hypothetical protein